MFLIGYRCQRINRKGTRECVAYYLDPVHSQFRGYDFDFDYCGSECKKCYDIVCENCCDKDGVCKTCLNLDNKIDDGDDNDDSDDSD